MKILIANKSNELTKKKLYVKCKDIKGLIFEDRIRPPKSPNQPRVRDDQLFRWGYFDGV